MDHEVCCSFGNCIKPVHSRGLCDNHYFRWKTGKALASRQRIDFTGVHVGDLLIVKRLDDNVWECICCICGQVLERKHHKLLESRTEGKRPFCGECLQLVASSDRAIRKEEQLQQRLRKQEARKEKVFLNRVIRSYRKGAEQRTLSWSLSEDDVRIVYQPCNYCGNPGDKEYRGIRYNGIDRVDNSRGYEAGNVVACCKKCNFAKSNMSLTTWNDWCASISLRFPTL